MKINATGGVRQSLQEAAPHEVRSVIGCFIIGCIILLVIVLFLTSLALRCSFPVLTSPDDVRRRLAMGFG